MKLIAFSGAQGTGKTTLLRKMKKDLRFVANPYHEYEFYDEITRKLKREGMKINEEGNDLTQQSFINNMHVITKNLNSVSEPYARVFDRCFLDVYCYTKYLHERGNVNDLTMNLAEQLLQDQKNKFDFIFYLKPEFDIEDDGVRSIDPKFRDDIARIFESTIHEKNIKVIQLTGSVNERYSTLTSILS